MMHIIITYPEFFSNEINQILSWLDDGDCRLHLRKPKASQLEIEALLRSIPAEYHPRIVLHDYHFLAEKYRLGGLHFSTQKRAEFFDKNALQCVSTSCHSIDELREIDGQFDYTFLSPVFPSISKPGYAGNLDMQEVATYLQIPHKTRVIALGGINQSKIEQVRKMGFDGYAMLGAAWKI
ncbi:MAG: thiamine phosphate synthase [Prevotellaceae bacterium]|jgi:thiamine-phosphate pyrophosphorylase|nr:thiamine phosphate synthase [Prevotellaceae bacterium]